MCPVRIDAKTNGYALMAVPVLGILTNSVVSMILSARLSSLEGRMTNLENRLEARLVALENTFNTRFDLLMGRLFDLERDIHKS